MSEAGDILDVLVLGGGCAGSAVATLLAERGHRVRVVEREPGPRFRIGESLLPCANGVLERLGLDLSPYLIKQGAAFVDEHHTDGVRRVRFGFEEGLGGLPGSTWQVERRRFDADLLARARLAGAEVVQGVRATEAAFGDAAVTLGTDDGTEHRARFLVDASGQAAFLGRKQRRLAPSRAFGRAAAFAHARALDPAAWAELSATGDITIFLRDDGWAWAIPLADRTLSVGFVNRDETLTEHTFCQGLGASPLLSRWTAGATWGEVQRVGDFSYLNTAARGARFACIGDAACFIDPVFSTGVSLALLGAERLADLLDPHLEAGTEADPDALAPLGEHLDHAYRVFAAFVHRFYATRLVNNLFFHPNPDADLRRGIVSVLAGDLWRDDNPFQAMLLNAAKTGRRRCPWPPELP